MTHARRRRTVGLLALVASAAEPAEPPPFLEAVKPAPLVTEREPIPALDENPVPERDDFPLRVAFGDGVTFSTPGDDFVLRIRLMAQIDWKLFDPSSQEPARTGLYIPRFRTYFEGRVTQSFEYELSVQRSVEGTFDVLDANVNYRPDDALQFKVGRMLVPYSYDWYDHLEQFFITPERGLFPLNFGLSREAGAMAWGRLADGGVQYAVGGFSGQSAGVADTNTTRDAVGYVNFRPFLQSEALPLLKNFNVGASGAVGRQAYAAQPLPLRTSLQSSENDEAAQAASAVFLEFDPKAAAIGSRRQVAAHVAWYVGPVSLEAEAQAGKFHYDGAVRSGDLPVSGFHVTLGCFVTGEEVEKRTVVVPVSPFDPAKGVYGPGAWEPFARYSRLKLGDQVFTDGLADPADWTNRAAVTDAGWNWYPNRFIKVTFDWQHSMYGSPVLINASTGEHRNTNDLYWLRTQISY